MGKSHVRADKTCLNCNYVVENRFCGNCGQEKFGDNAVVDTISIIINLGGYGWMIYYLFPAHHRFYGETRLISFIKTLLLFFINLFFMALLFLVFFVYSFINIH